MYSKYDQVQACLIVIRCGIQALITWSLIHKGVVYQLTLACVHNWNNSTFFADSEILRGWKQSPALFVRIEVWWLPSQPKSKSSVGKQGNFLIHQNITQPVPDINGTNMDPEYEKRLLRQQNGQLTPSPYSSVSIEYVWKVSDNFVAIWCEAGTFQCCFAVCSSYICDTKNQYVGVIKFLLCCMHTDTQTHILYWLLITVEHIYPVGKPCNRSIFWSSYGISPYDYYRWNR